MLRRSARLSVLLLSMLVPHGVASAQAGGLAELRRQLESPDAQVRLQVVQDLVKLGTTPAAQALFAALADRDETVRTAAAVAFGTLGKKGISVLTAALDADDENRQLLALTAIGKLGADAVPLLRRVTKLWRQEKMTFNTAIEKCMVALGKHAVPELIRCVDEFGVQQPACNALGEIGSDAKAAVPVLCKLMLSKTAGRSAAASALRGIRDPASVPDLAKVLLEEAKNPGTTSTATNAASALAAIGPAAEAAVPALLTLLATTGSAPELHRDRTRCVFALGQIGDRSERVRAALMKVVKEETGDLQKEAKECLLLFELAEDASDALLATAIMHPSADLVALGLQRAATRRAAGPGLTSAIALRVTRAPDRGLRLAAIAALVAVGAKTTEALQALEKAAADADAEIAAAAHDARTKLGG